MIVRITQPSKKRNLNSLGFFILLFFLSINFSEAQNCTVNAGTDETICANEVFAFSGGTAGLVLSGPTWSQISGPSVIIDDPTDPESTVTGFV